MRIPLRRSLLPAAAALILSIQATAPASAQMTPSGQNMSNHDIRHVRHRLEIDLTQLQHDDRDYGGHRVNAINDIQAARNELLAAEKFEHGQAMSPYMGANGAEPGVRSQGNSNQNIWRVEKSLERLIDQLQQDAHDYGGHRIAAIGDLKNARTELLAAENLAKIH
jgi:hypothetical protein